MSVRVGAMIAFVSRVSFAESGCAATPAPPGYVGDCPGGTTCSTFISCAAGYNSSSYSFPGASCYGGGSFYYYGCSMPSSVFVCAPVCGVRSKEGLLAQVHADVSCR